MMLIIINGKQDIYGVLCRKYKNMARHNYFKWYEVRLHDTGVTPVYANNFRRLPAGHARAALQLLPAEDRFTGYPDLIIALEKAKAGALSYLEQLAKAGKEQEIICYRIAHYEDLNINLTDRNIRRVEQALATDPNYHWQPYRINS